ncbi:hypothetical protein [Candidatus Methylobacter oryzae]|uniref:Uncharacterized protein n=1 Tax=Candidatus Methylobacter oryzae TaxID=2497749 RepID=A0ABY3CH83_9GAMM|nr:hypothetical protein [Candidatus Methylobacter oryzae]TRX03579.1 hypothetical protein EKO24_000330 [Candidatus Methylobacter oryzae]
MTMMPRKNFVHSFFIMLVVLISSIFSAPAIADQSVLYQSVKAEQKWNESRSKSLIIKDNEVDSPYLIEKNELYLIIQATRTKWFLYVEVDQPEWDESKIQSLIKEHPDLVKFFPNPLALNGGVMWIATAATTGGELILMFIQSSEIH